MYLCILLKMALVLHNCVWNDKSFDPTILIILLLTCVYYAYLYTHKVNFENKKLTNFHLHCAVHWTNLTNTIKPLTKFICVVRIVYLSRLFVFTCCCFFSTWNFCFSFLCNNTCSLEFYFSCLYLWKSWG